MADLLGAILRIEARSLPALVRRSCGQSGGARFIRGSSFPFSFRAFRSAPGGKVRSLGAPREPSRAGGLGRGRRGGRSRWRRKNREPVAVVGRAAAGRPGFGRRAFPRRQRQFRSGRAKKQATKRRTKKDFPSPERRRFVKTGFSARYKEAHRSGRPRGRKSPRPGKGDRRCRLSHFAVKKSGRRGRLSRFAVKKSGRRGRLSRFAAANSGRRGRLLRFAVKKSCTLVGFRASPCETPGRLVGFRTSPQQSPGRCRLSHFAVQKSRGAVGFCTLLGESPGAWSALRPQGGSNLRERFLRDRGALSREFPTNRGPGGPTPKIAFSRPMVRLFCCEKECAEAGGFP